MDKNDFTNTGELNTAGTDGNNMLKNHNEKRKAQDSSGNELINYHQNEYY